MKPKRIPFWTSLGDPFLLAGITAHSIPLMPVGCNIPVLVTGYSQDQTHSALLYPTDHTVGIYLAAIPMWLVWHDC